MPTLEIEREIVVEAPIDVVWHIVTDPEQMTGWFADEVDLVVEPGARGSMRFGGQGGPVAVERVDRPTTFAFRWNFPTDEDPGPDNSTLVVFTLQAVGPERTIVKVVESGHEQRDWPADEQRRYADEHQSGWGDFLARLAQTADRSG